MYSRCWKKEARKNMSRLSWQMWSCIVQLCMKRDKDWYFCHSLTWLSIVHSILASAWGSKITDDLVGPRPLMLKYILNNSTTERVQRWPFRQTIFLCIATAFCIIIEGITLDCFFSYNRQCTGMLCFVYMYCTLCKGDMTHRQNINLLGTRKLRLELHFRLICCLYENVFAVVYWGLILPSLYQPSFAHMRRRIHGDWIKRLPEGEFPQITSAFEEPSYTLCCDVRVFFMTMSFWRVWIRTKTLASFVIVLVKGQIKNAIFKFLSHYGRFSRFLQISYFIVKHCTYRECRLWQLLILVKIILLSTFLEQWPTLHYEPLLVLH